MRESGSMWWDVKLSAYAQLGCLRHTFKWGFQKARDLAYVESKRGWYLLKNAMPGKLVLSIDGPVPAKSVLYQWAQEALKKWESAGRAIGDIQ